MHHRCFLFDDKTSCKLVAIQIARTAVTEASTWACSMVGAKYCALAGCYFGPVGGLVGGVVGALGGAVLGEIGADYIIELSKQ